LPTSVSGRERERENSKWDWEGSQVLYYYGILMADKEIKAEGFCEAFFFIASLFGLGK
jgi:hypothetical protein